MLDKLHEECGVFGIFGHAEAANMAYLGLYALQHRGQESAGIASSDGRQIHVSRAMAYVNDAFDEVSRGSLVGSRAVGHVRVATAGGSRLGTAGPLVIDCAHVEIAICHNGNLVNATELKDQMVREGAIFQTTTDSEVILHLYARSKAPTAEGAIVEALSEVRGAFSLAA